MISPQSAEKSPSTHTSQPVSPVIGVTDPDIISQKVESAISMEDLCYGGHLSKKLSQGLPQYLLYFHNPKLLASVLPFYQSLAAKC